MRVKDGNNLVSPCKHPLLAWVEDSLVNHKPLAATCKVHSNPQYFLAVDQNYKRLLLFSVHLQLEASSKQVRDCSDNSLRCNKLHLEDCLVKLPHNNQLKAVFSRAV